MNTNSRVFRGDKMNGSIVVCLSNMMIEFRRRLIIGARAKPKIWAAAVTDITTRIFLTKEDSLSLDRICCN